MLFHVQDQDETVYVVVTIIVLFINKVIIKLFLLTFHSLTLTHTHIWIIMFCFSFSPLLNLCNLLLLSILTFCMLYWKNIENIQMNVIRALMHLQLKSVLLHHKYNINNKNKNKYKEQKKHVLLLWL